MSFLPKINKNEIYIKKIICNHLKLRNHVYTYSNTENKKKCLLKQKSDTWTLTYVYKNFFLLNFPDWNQKEKSIICNSMEQRRLTPEENKKY